MPKASKTVKGKPTLKDINETLLKAAADKRAEIMTVLNCSEVTAYDIIHNRRVCSIAEREAIAKIYGYEVNAIAWLEKNKLIA